MSETRIGIIGGLSWESTASYYRLFNELFVGATAWLQPQLLIDSVDFGAIVPLQREGNWEATGEILATSAQRLERAGATVLGIGANTMHVNHWYGDGVLHSSEVDVHRVGADAEHRCARALETLCRGGQDLSGGFPVTLSLQWHDRSEIDRVDQELRLQPRGGTDEQFVEKAIVRGRGLPGETADDPNTRFTHRRRLEVADEIDAFHYLGREQWHHVEGRHVLSNLRGVRGARDDRRHVGVHRAPRERELGE